MTFEIRRIAPLKTANVLAIVAAVVLTVFTLPLVPLVFAMPTHGGPNPKDQEFLGKMMIVMLFFYPVMGAICGWLTGLIGSSVYNLVSRRLGGIQVVLMVGE